MVTHQISLRKRFSIILVLFVAIFSVVALYTNKAARETIDDSHDLSLELRQIGLSISDISDTLHLLGVAMYQSTLYEDEDQPETIQLRLEQLAHHVNKLLLMNAVKSNHDFYEPALALSENFRSLTIHAQSLLELQSDYSRKYPAMPIMINNLEPINREMVGLIISAIEEAKQGLSDKPEQQQVLNLLKDIRYVWSQMVSSVRVFVANRLGAFGPPRSTMSAISKDRVIYHDTLLDLFAKLDELKTQNVLDLVQSESFRQMKNLQLEYEFYFKKAEEIYLSDQWRSDRILLKDATDPALEIAWAQLYLLQNRLNENTRLGLNQFARTADNLSLFVGIVTVVAIVLFIIGYITFELVIRKPIAQIAAALEAEGKGKGEIVRPQLDYTVKETGVLLNAFSKMQDQIRSRQLRLQTILDNAGEGILTITIDGKIESINLAAQELFGFKESEVRGRDVSVIIPAYLTLSPSNRQGGRNKKTEFELVQGEHEVFGKARDGRVFPISLRLEKVEIEGATLFTALVSDISERKAMIDRLTQLAERDSLTGLYNRHFLMDELERIVDRLKRGEKQTVALLYIDLDNFKYVNDTMGHLSGDSVLQEVTKILEQRARGTDLVTRLGGDEFAIVLYDVDAYQAHVTADAYRMQLADYVYRFEGKVVDIGCSIGVALMDENIKHKEDILSRADLACHIAKRSGRNRVHIYEPQDQESINIMSADMGWSRRLKTAMECDNFLLASQPIVDTCSGEILFNEVLIRLKEAGENIIMPSGFLPSAERFGLSVDLDRWVIEHSLQLLAQNHNKDFPGFSINLSAKTVGDSKTLELIESKIRDLSLPANKLLFEVTESIALSNINLASDFLLKLKQLGCQTALDDFGAGYSSFSYLKDLPVDFVKLDGSYIKRITRDKVKRAIVVAMNDVAHALGKKTIAEFVEDVETLEELKAIGLDYCQGFYTGKPKLVAAEPENVVYLHKK